MSKHTHTAIHTIHRRSKDDKPEEIKAGSQFTPIDSDQAKYLEESGAARKLAKGEAVAEEADTGSASDKTDPPGKKGVGKKGSDKKDDELL